MYYILCLIELILMKLKYSFMLRIECGSTRSVVILKNYVLKFPLKRDKWKDFSIGLDSNANEIAIWNSSNKKVKKLLCPIVFNFFNIMVVMKRAHDIGWVPVSYVDHMNNKLFLNNIIPNDLRRGNMGIIDGHIPVVTDYAFFAMQPKGFKWNSEYKNAGWVERSDFLEHFPVMSFFYSLLLKDEL